ncbi:retrovirus-related pol polyprotein from transposon TNT 1-94 [Tanacetum coccineum]|uniref:Retrovirus-related pol polyprotein from transposon TNT 1-94 n=1 Tax=Tanacetum coccineum TaxID=301880 RepID=A0ABQ4ZEU8_9ASTR
MAAEVPQTLEYRGGQLNDVVVLEVKIFTNWKKRFMCHIIGIEPQFKNIIENGPYVPMTAGQKKPAIQWTGDERKAANLDHEQIPSQKKRILGVDQLTEDSSSSRLKDLVFIKSLADDIKVTIPGVERAWLSEAEYESLVCSTPLPPLKKLDGVEPISGPKTIKSILRSKSAFKAEALKSVIINEPSSTPTKGNKSFSASKVHSAPAGKLKNGSALKNNSAHAGKLKNVKTEDDSPLSIKCERTDHRTCDHAEYMSTMNMTQHLKSQGGYSSRSKTSRPSKHFPYCIHCGFNDHLSDDYINYPICDISGSYDHDTHGYNRVISLRRGIKPRNPQQVTKSCETCGSTVHTTTDHNDFEWFRRGEALQATKAEAFQSKRTESSNANRSKTPTKSRCSRHMTSVKSYLHKYVEQPGPKVVFGDDSTCITEGYGSITCNGIVFIKVAFVNGLKYNLVSISQLCDAKYVVQFDEKRGTIFNFNKEIVMIASRVRDVYVLDMTSSAQESCFFVKATKNLNWLWHKRLAHLNFKTINQLAKQNLVIGLPSLVYSKDKPCSSCEKGKHHRASFKTKQTSSIKKYLHLLHMDLFGPVTPRSINHEKYTLVIVDEYSRYTWVYFLKKKSHAPETIMSFIKRVENQNDIKIKQLRTDNGTEFRNSILVNFCDEKGISQNFSSPYTPEQNGVAESKNRTLIEAARTMLSGSAFRVFNTRRQQTEETYHIKIDDSTDAIKFTKPSDDNITITKSERYPPDEYLHPYEPSQRVMAKELSAASTYECLFVDFLSEEEPKKVSEALKHPGWVDAMQEELNQFSRNKVWILARLVAQGYNQQEGIYYDETFAPVVRLEAIRIFLAFATYMNFTVYQMDVKSAFLNEKMKEDVYVKQPTGFESSEFPNHVYKLDKIKQSERGISINQEKYVKDLLKKYDINGSSVKTPMVPPNNLGPDLNGKAVNEPRYQANPKESHLIAVKRIFRYLKGTPSLGLWCLSVAKQQFVALSSSEAEYVAAAGCCANILWMKSQHTDYDIIYENVPIFCHNTSAIAISNNPVLHSRTKHIDIRYHFIRYHILKGDIELHFIPT